MCVTVSETEKERQREREKTKEEKKFSLEFHEGVVLSHSSSKKLRSPWREDRLANASEVKRWIRASVRMTEKVKREEVR